MDETLLHLVQSLNSGDMSAVGPFKDLIAERYVGLHAAIAVAFYGHPVKKKRRRRPAQRRVVGETVDWGAFSMSSAAVPSIGYYEPRRTRRARPFGVVDDDDEHRGFAPTYRG